MGLLDDAIREHLELKRRRGADPSELAREEAEALGPVRRESAVPTATQTAPAEEHAGLEDPGEAYAEEVLEEHVHDEPRFEEEPLRDEEPPHEERPLPAEDERDRPQPAEPPATHDRPFPEREEESATPPHGDPYQPTREFSAQELEAALGRGGEPAEREAPADDEAAAEGEDVLEETPDFLQETPEHDRLWFEQKPPKDFDF